MTEYTGYLILDDLTYKSVVLEIVAPAGTLYIEQQTHLKIVPGESIPQPRIHNEIGYIKKVGNYGKDNSSIMDVRVDVDLVLAVKEAVREKQASDEKLKNTLSTILDSV